MAAEGPPDWAKLPASQKLAHAKWDARSAGYTEMATKFKRADPEEDAKLFDDTAPALKKWAVEANAMALERALDAITAWVDGAPEKLVTRVQGEVAGPVREKGLGAARAGSKKRAHDLLLLMIEASSKPEPVITEMIKGWSHKRPPIVAACVAVVTDAVAQFGVPAIPPKPIMKAVAALFAHKDKKVRDEADKLVIELHRWLKQAVRPAIESLRPEQIKKLEEGFAAHPEHAKVPPRYLRAHQPKDTGAGAEGRGDGDGASGDADGVDEAAGTAAIDPLDLIDPVDILSKLPSSWHTEVASKKWSERKDALEALHKLASAPKLERGDYGDVIRALVKVISKDVNVNCVAAAVHCVTALATGLRGGYSPYAKLCVAPMLAKFKERKATVTDALAEALDALYPHALAPYDVTDECLAAMANKVPKVRSAVIEWIGRCVKRSGKATLSKFVKPFGPALNTATDDADKDVRDASFAVFGQIVRVYGGERVIAKYLDDMAPARQQKVREAVAAAGGGGGSSGGAAAPDAALGAAAAGGAGASSGGLAASSVARVKASASAPSLPRQDPKGKGKAAAGPTPAISKSSAPSGASKAAGGSLSKSASATSTPTTSPTKRRRSGARSSTTSLASAASGAGSKGSAPSAGGIPDAEVESRAAAMLPAAVRTGLTSKVWKERLEAVTELQQLVASLDAAGAHSQAEVIVRTLQRTPGLKESNFMVLSKTFETMQMVYDKADWLEAHVAEHVVVGIAEKLADIKVRKAAHAVLTSIVEASGATAVMPMVFAATESHKNPKVVSEALLWFKGAVEDFGVQVIPARQLMLYVQRQMEHMNAAVRSSARAVVATVAMSLGDTVLSFFTDVKPATKSEIEAAIAKVASAKVEEPTRKIRAPTRSAGASGAAGSTAGSDSLLGPRADVSASLTGKLIDQLGSSSWNERQEALGELDNILQAAKHHVDPNSLSGDLMPALKQRLSDSNKMLVITTLKLVASISQSCGSGVDRFTRLLMPAVVACAADSKKHVRDAVIATLDAWVKATGSLEHMLPAMLAQLLDANTHSRTELLAWLTRDETLIGLEKAAAGSSDVAQSFLKPVLVCMEDRNTEVRKRADVLLARVLIPPLGYPAVVAEVKNAAKPAAVKAMMALIEKHNPAPAASSSVGGEEGGVGGGTTPRRHASTKSLRAGDGASGASGALRRTASSRTVKGGSALGTSTSTSSLASAASAARAVPALKPGSVSKDVRQRRSRKVKWLFEEPPRPEFVDKTRELLKACVNAELAAMLFSKDFRQHLAALAALQDCLTHQGDETVQVLDLLFRWVALRLIDGNSSVTIKTVEYLNALMDFLVERQYQWSEYEASVLLPVLVEKVGNNSESVRTGLRAVLTRTSDVYTPRAVFDALLVGADNKNSRTRAECIEEAGSMVARFGTSVCGSMSKCVPLLAVALGDRDASVRQVAVDTMIAFHEAIGADALWKLLKSVPEAHRSAIEERLKRQKSADGSASASASTSSLPTLRMSRSLRDVSTPGKAGAAARRESPRRRGAGAASGSRLPGSPSKSKLPVPTSSGQFSLDLDHMPDPVVSTPAPALPKGLTSSPEIPRTPDAVVPERKPTFDSRSPFASAGSVAGAVTDTPAEQQQERVASEQARVDQHIAALTEAQDAALCVASLKFLCDRLESQEAAVVMEAGRWLPALTAVVRAAFVRHSDSSRLAKYALNTLMQVFQTRNVSVVVSQSVLEKLVTELLVRLLDDNMATMEDGEQLLRALNLLMLKVLENADRTTSFGVLLHCLRLHPRPDEPALASPPFVNLVLRCLIKLTKTLAVTIDDLDLNSLLRDIHLYLVAHPPASQPMDDSPDAVAMKTVHTILNEIVKLKGVVVRSHLSLIPVARNPAIVQLIDDMLNTHYPSVLSPTAARASAQPEAAAMAAAPSPSPSGTTDGGASDDVSVASAASSTAPTLRPPPSALTVPAAGVVSARGSNGSARSHASAMSAMSSAGCSDASSAVSLSPASQELKLQLAEIFKKIGRQEHTQDGIMMLHRFQKEHPDVDISPHLMATSGQFRSYIERSLRAVEEKENAGDTPQRNGVSSIPVPAAMASSGSSSSAASGDQLASVYMKRLQQLQQRYDLNVPGGTGSVPATSNSPTSPGKQQPGPVTVDAASVPAPAGASTPPSQADPQAAGAAEATLTPSVSDLRARLARFKKPASTNE